LLTYRLKESALDYRFMPEADLPPLVIPQQVLAELKRTTPELPAATAARLQAAHGLTRPQVPTRLLHHRSA
jgi:aspartyl-tRNA(Asn)/glutamyl-tRNA(Gln) amidotransferase subunit B